MLHDGPSLCLHLGWAEHLRLCPGCAFPTCLSSFALQELESCSSSEFLKRLSCLWRYLPAVRAAAFSFITHLGSEGLR